MTLAEIAGSGYVYLIGAIIVGGVLLAAELSETKLGKLGSLLYMIGVIFVIAFGLALFGLI